MTEIEFNKKLTHYWINGAGCRYFRSSSDSRENPLANNFGKPEGPFAIIWEKGTRALVYQRTDVAEHWKKGEIFWR